MSKKNKHLINNKELLQIYYDEWKYRLDNFRKHIIQLVIIIFFTSSLPVTVNIFNGVRIPQMPLIIFPISGILLTIVFCWYSFSESSRISALDSQIKLIVKDNFPKKYSKASTNYTKHKKLHTMLGKRMTIWIPIAISLMEIAIAVLMIYLIVNDAIVIDA